MMIKKITTLGAMMLLSLSVWAGDDTISARSALKQKLHEMQQYRADFEQTVTDNEGALISEASGSLVMARPDKLRWHTKTPDETLLIADGESVFNVDSFVEQVTIIDQAQAVRHNPVILLTTQSAEVWNDFNIAYADSQQDFVINPVQADGQVQSLSLFFDDNVLTSLTMTDAQLQTNKLTFSAIDTDFNPDASLFEVDAPDSYVIDDQR
ncbi:outer membrane lipoprotein chaperone LolA [Alteromonas halophila]|uniref:Outer-membrane lipoprotein carrier protein n=1 Tax=Alteromonas halophila TaxID=516698 RepID=A0A918JRW5_9ALTE|nr:outer membrane lipoprotein chaperone LolA [Alteromonas halophila]GGW97401.1 outer-membrane lipoprotein carrier protein [Alteromonas halophila]